VVKNLALVVLASASSGCFGTFHTATPIPPETVEIGIIPGTVIETNDGALLPSAEFAVRVGIRENLDLGLQTNFVGVMFDANFAPILTESFALSINPAIGTMYVPSFLNSRAYPAEESYTSSGRDDPTIALASLAVLVDVLKSKGLSLTLGFKPTLALTISEFEPHLYFSGMIGTKIRVTDQVSIMPMVEGMNRVKHFSQDPLLRLSLGIFF